MENRRATLVAIPLRWAAAVWVAAIAAASIMLTHVSPSLGAEGGLGIGLLLGGATSNLADRVVKGSVTDFISVGIWPTFNLADAAMVTGAVLLTASAL